MIRDTYLGEPLKVARPLKPTQEMVDDAIAASHARSENSAIAEGKMLCPSAS